MLLTTPNHIKIMPKQSLSQVDKLSIGTSVLEPNSDMVDLRLPIASFTADSNQLDKFVVSSVMSSGKAIGVHEIGLWHEGELVAIIYKTHDRVNHQPLFLIKPNFIYLVNLQIDEQTVTLTVDERDDLSFAMAGVLANTGKQSRSEKIALTNQFKALVDKDSSLENKIISLTGNVATVQHTADNASEKADTATTKADNAQNTANNALSRANTANSAITAEQRARADGDSSLASQISALDTAYKSADSALSGRITTAQQTATNTEQALATAQSQLNARFDSLSVGGRNLLRASNNTHNFGYGKRFELTQAPNVGDNVVVTIWGEIGSDRNGLIGVYNSHAWTELFACTKIADGVYQGKGRWGKPIANGQELTPNDTHLNVYFYPRTATSDNRIDKIKLERGNIATDWTPAPEDLVNGLLVYSTTTAQSPNVFVSENGQMQRSTSSERYKHIIGDLTLDKKSYQKAMSLNPIIYRSTAENDNPDWHYYSFSAEKLGAFDKAFTLWRTPTTSSYDDDGNEIVTTGEPIAEGINLNAVVAFLHATNLHQGMLIDELTKRIEVLEQNQNME